MNAISRFFVNTFGTRRNRRRSDWIRSSLAIPAGGTFLEIGCGNGDMAARLVAGFRPARYVATDLDPRQIEVARQHLGHRPGGIPPEVQIETADMLHLPYPDRAFDAVFAFLAIHHAGRDHHDFSPIPPALAELDRVLKPGGVLVYEEFLHKDAIQAWLRLHGFSLGPSLLRGRRETVVARKAGA